MVPSYTVLVVVVCTERTFVTPETNKTSITADEAGINA
jgi:hypothetical protein